VIGSPVQGQETEATLKLLKKVGRSHSVEILNEVLWINYSVNGVELASKGICHDRTGSYVFSRVRSQMKLVSQLLPPSAENACSQWHESGEFTLQVKRTKMLFPS
jgi:hypothetical protein